MNKEFDFDDIGKKTPYRTPEILAGVLFVPSYLQTRDVPAGTSDMLAVDRSSSDPADKWIHELSDEELEELVDFSDNDIFLN